jgi:thiol-disulfide isomerase/thioredoxin
MGPLVLLVLLVLLFCAAFAVRAADAPGPISVAPAWSLQTPEGRTVNYPADAQGRPTVLLFWPSWCPFSRALQPYVQDIWIDYRDRGVNVWTLNIKEDGDPLKAMRERGLSFPLLLKADAVANDYRVSRTPWLVVMDGQQNILYTRPADPPTPIDVAKRVREVLNGLLGARAVPLPTRYPPPYDLHLKRKEDLVDRTQTVPIAESEWQPWVVNYLDAIPAGETRKDLAPRGRLDKGRDAIALAKSLWAEAYGQAEVDAQAPYRAFRRNDRWVVLGQGLDRKLGEGLVLVVEASTGQVIRMSRPATPAPR